MDLVYLPCRILNPSQSSFRSGNPRNSGDATNISCLVHKTTQLISLNFLLIFLLTIRPTHHTHSHSPLLPRWQAWNPAEQPQSRERRTGHPSLDGLATHAGLERWLVIEDRPVRIASQRDWTALTVRLRRIQHLQDSGCWYQHSSKPPCRMAHLPYRLRSSLVDSSPVNRKSTTLTAVLAALTCSSRV